jgi:hypothetical protein
MAARGIFESPLTSMASSSGDDEDGGGRMELMSRGRGTELKEASSRRDRARLQNPSC